MTYSTYGSEGDNESLCHGFLSFPEVLFSERIFSHGKFRKGKQ